MVVVHSPTLEIDTISTINHRFYLSRHDSNQSTARTMPSSSLSGTQHASAATTHSNNYNLLMGLVNKGIITLISPGLTLFRALSSVQVASLMKGDSRHQIICPGKLMNFSSSEHAQLKIENHIQNGSHEVTEFISFSPDIKFAIKLAFTAVQGGSPGGTVIRVTVPNPSPKAVFFMVKDFAKEEAFLYTETGIKKFEIINLLSENVLSLFMTNHVGLPAKPSLESLRKANPLIASYHPELQLPALERLSNANDTPQTCHTTQVLLGLISLNIQRSIEIPGLEMNQFVSLMYKVSISDILETLLMN